MRMAWFFIGVVLLSAITFQAGVSPELFEDTSQSALLTEAVAPDISIVLTSGLDRHDIALIISEALDYDQQTTEQFHDTYRSMQWDAFNDVIVPHLVGEYGLNESEQEILLTHATRYLTADDDILESLYEAGTYTMTASDTVVSIATKLIDPILKTKLTRVPELIDRKEAENLILYLEKESELLPDLVPLPPQDIVIRNESGRRLLAFTTIYYNKGRGNLELVGDPEKAGIRDDHERNVFQRIYKDDGTYRERVAGTFKWHQEHLHYHFSDFIEYRLEAFDSEEMIEGALAQKSTFCIRDVSRVDIEGMATTSDAEYQICGKERQGVTLGWGDAYFNTYVDQNLDITVLPSGRYILTFIANPSDRFDEVTKDNNTSSATIVYDRERGTVEVESIEPSTIPDFEHIHVEQVCNNCTL